MRNSQHVAKLGEGPRAWNAWRSENPDVVPDLNDLDLSVGRRQFGPIQGGPIDLSGAELCRADLEHATLIEADLTGATLVLADLSHARMTRADLRDANLSHAHLDHADLEDARLDEAILCGAHLRQARNLTQAQVDCAVGDANTTLPPDLAMPKGWLKHPKAKSSQLARKRIDPKIDARADLFALLGVKYGASIREARAAYLKLVKELHPDGRQDDPIAGERLRTINKAYQDLKVLQRRAAAMKAESGFFSRPSALFFVGFVTSGMSMAVVFGGLYYAGFFSPNAIRPIATEVESKRPVRAARPDDIITGSISDQASDQAKGARENRDEAATAQLDAAHVASVRDAADDAAWAEAQREGTSVSLHRYLGRYPNGRHARKATEELAAVAKSEIALGKTYDWRDARAAEAARLTLRHYLEIHPDGRLAAEVRAKLGAIDAAEATLLADHAAWAEAERNATWEAMRRYLDAYPDGNNAAKAGRAIAAMEATEAKQRADRTAWAEAERTGTRDAWRQYLDAYPDGHNIAKARQKLALLEAADSARVRDDTEWAEAQRQNTKASYTVYLGAYPNGRHAKDARVSIAALESPAPKEGPVSKEALAPKGGLAPKTEGMMKIKASKQGPQMPRTGPPDPPVSQRWQSADEPFIGADGRIRQR